MINEQKLIDTFFELVRIDSPSGYEDEVCAYIVQKLKYKKIPYKTDSYGNLIAFVKGKNETPIMLTAHMDTVEPGRGVEPIISGNVIKCRSNTILGADNKAGVAAILEAVLQSTDPPENTLELVFTRTEEVGNLGAVNLNYNLLKSKTGFSFDTGGEIGNIIVASPYYLRFNFKLVGKSAHAGNPEEAINVLPTLASALVETQLGRISPDTLCNIGVINCGGVRNTIPGEITVLGEVRSYMLSELEETYNRVKIVFEKQSAKNGVNFKHEESIENPGFFFTEQENAVKYAQKVMRKCGLESKLVKATGCYDANVFFEKGIKIINFSNGGYANHTTNEEISVTDLCTTARLVGEILQVGYTSEPNNL